MPTTEYLPYSGTHACADIDTTIEEVRAARGNESSLNARINADVSALNTAIATKANSSDVTAGLALKADTSTVNAALATKANASDVTAALATKANASDVTTALAAKANTSDVDSALLLKADASDLAATDAIVADLQSEVGNAKEGANGKEYDTLKERLDAEIKGVQSDVLIQSLSDMNVCIQDVDGTIHRDIIASAVYKENTTITQAAFIESTMYDYFSNATESQTAKLSNPIRIRNFDGTQIADILCTYGSALQSAYIGFGFKKDGTHDVKYDASNVSNGKIVFSADTYYFVVLKYSTVPLTMTCTISGDNIDSFANKLSFMSLLDMQSVEVVSGGVLKHDVIDSLPATLNSTMTAANFEASTIYDYKSHLTSSSSAKVVDIVRVRNADGSMICPLHCEYGSNIDQANICFGFKKDGTHDRVYKAVDVSNGILTLDASTYFIVILKYSTVDLDIYTLYGKMVIGDRAPHYTVGTGMDFTSFTACIRALANDSSEKVIDIYGGEYDVLEEMGGDDFLATLDGTENWYDVCDIVPPNTTIQGHGNVRIIMELPDDLSQSVAALLAPVNIRGTTTIRNVHIIGKNCRYAIHPEGSKEAQFDNAIWLIEDCYIEKTEDSGVSVTGVGFACGLNDGVQFIISRTDIYTNCQAGFSMHDNGIVYDVSPRVTIDSCSINADTYPLIFSCTNRAGMQTVIEVRVSNTFLNNGYCRKRTSSDTAKDCYKCTYINSPHRTQHGSNLTDPIPDVNYDAYATS